MNIKCDVYTYPFVISDQNLIYIILIFIQGVLDINPISCKY